MSPIFLFLRESNWLVFNRVMWCSSWFIHEHFAFFKASGFAFWWGFLFPHHWQKYEQCIHPIFDATKMPRFLKMELAWPKLYHFIVTRLLISFSIILYILSLLLYFVILYITYTLLFSYRLQYYVNINKNKILNMTASWLN